MYRILGLLMLLAVVWYECLEHVMTLGAYLVIFVLTAVHEKCSIHYTASVFCKVHSNSVVIALLMQCQQEYVVWFD